jgi:hypothetical protein
MPRRRPVAVAADAARVAEAAVDAIQDGIESRYRLAADFYRQPPGEAECGRYGVAELSYLRWEIERGVLDVPAERGGGSQWWRSVNDALLRDKAEARRLVDVDARTASSRRVELWLRFVSAPSPASWYRAHNASIVAGYLEHEPLAREELPAERFMMNVALLRVIYAHALAAAPRLALGPFAPLGRRLGDPRRSAVRFFLDLRDQFPAEYPLDQWDLEDLIRAEGRIPRALDYGLIAPRLTELYAFAADCLGEPRLTSLVRDGIPCYSLPTAERAQWLGGSVRPLPRMVAMATGRLPPAP